MDAGYDPQGMFSVMTRFLKADEKRVPYFYDYYQARPITQERMQIMREAFSGLPLEEKSLVTNYQVYQEMTKGVREIYR